MNPSVDTKTILLNPSIVFVSSLSGFFIQVYWYYYSIGVSQLQSNLYLAVILGEWCLWCFIQVDLLIQIPQIRSIVKRYASYYAIIDHLAYKDSYTNTINVDFGR